MLVNGAGESSKTFSPKTQVKCTMQMDDVRVVGRESLTAELPYTWNSQPRFTWVELPDHDLMMQ